MLIVGVPVLIHLINMLRHRRVRWAAMEFLMVSQKRNRTRVLLKQLLLLLMRMLAIATIVLVVAQPLLRDEIGRIFGGGKTHHIVLLDDSYSMADRWADTSALDEGKSAIQRIGAVAARQVQPQTFTLLRFSQAQRVARGTQPDMLAEPVDSEFAERLDETLRPLQPSETAAGPAEALEAIEQLLGEDPSEDRVVYLVSDFRARQWEKPGDLRLQLEELDSVGARLYLVDCVDATRPNLGIVRLEAVSGTRAAGVPLFVEVSVQNYGTTPARDVPVLLEEDGHSRPAITIGRIPPGETVTERFLAHFPTAGQHRLVARLESDVLASDNQGFLVVDLPLDVPVLIVDGDPEALDARFIAAALAPGGPVRTGLQPQIETPRFLAVQPLDSFHAIYVANVERLDAAAVEALEQYVAAGGGVAFFLGERSRARFINEELYKGGEGLFPAPVVRPVELLVDRLEKAPDLKVTDHPIFKVLTGQRNTFLSTVLVERYFSVPEEWKPASSEATRVIAALRNGAPLALEHRLGEGRVIAMLTTAAPVWNNWARNNPSFVVAMQELQAYLSADRTVRPTYQVGRPLELALDPALFQPQVRFVLPESDDMASATTDASPTDDGTLEARLADTDASGVYEARLLRVDGTPELRTFALNVDPEEGDLKTLTGSDLASRLDGVRYQYALASAFQYSADELAGFNLAEPLLYLLILLLIGEQLLAAAVSYHPSSPPSAAAKGGAR
jgi:hypothetical protein